MLPRYKLKTTEIFTAVQHKDDPMSMMWITEMVPEDRLICSEKIEIKIDLEWITVDVSDYILKDKYGLSVISKEIFEAEYEQV